VGASQCLHLEEPEPVKCQRYACPQGTEEKKKKKKQQQEQQQKRLESKTETKEPGQILGNRRERERERERES
jgi:hypothetical protein